jgi:hypothetical protein
MWTNLTSRAQQALQRSHAIKVRGTAYGASIGKLENLPITDGEVVVDGTSQVRRTATIHIANPKLWPRNPLDILSPFGSQLLVEYGIVLSRTETEWVPLIRGVISDADRERSATRGDGTVVLSLSDKSSLVAEDRFDAPIQTISGATVVAEITRLIQETIPGVTVLNLTGSVQVAPVLDVERERWADAIEKLADAIGAEVYADPAGGFVIRLQPKITDGAVWTVASGRGGILIAKREKLTRDKVYNRVIAIGERVDGAAPVRSGVSDDDPASPTRYGGLFGKKPRFYSSPLLTTTGQCTAAATSMLERVKGVQASVSLSAIVNPALEAGDVVDVFDEGRRQAHIIDRVNIPLKVGTAQSIDTRSLDLEAE